MLRPKVVFITGCTASGKSALAHSLGLELGAEILSVDSMKVYRYMDIGTAKPTRKMQEELPYHLIDVVDPSEAFSAGLFVELAEKAIEKITSRGKLVIAVGGTALYLKSLSEGIFREGSASPELRERLKKEAEEKGLGTLYKRLMAVDPEAAERIHPNDLKRIVRALEVYELTGRPISSFQRQFGRLREDYDMLFLGLRWEKDRLNRRINARVKRMIEQGLVEEVEWLYKRRPPLSPQAKDAVGYAEIIAYLEGRCDLPEAIERIKINTRRFAKHQRTWFKRFTHVRWFDLEDEEDLLKAKEEFIAKIEDWLGGLR